MARLLAGQGFSLVLLSLQLGQEDGLDLLRGLRAHAELPVIIMTGHRRDEVNRVVGLELGAGDCILKPFSLRELLARVRVVLRRSDAAAAAAAGSPAVKDRGKPAGQPRFGGWTLDRRTRRLTDPGGRPAALGKGERALLVAFLDAAAALEPGAPAASGPCPQGRVRPQHGRADPAPPPEAGGRPKRPRRDPDRARRGMRLCPRCDAGAAGA